MDSLNRRTFVGGGAGALAGMTLSALKPQRVLGANDKVNIASIGLKAQGWGVTNSMIQSGMANIVSVCDVDENELDEKARRVWAAQDAEPKMYKDFREALDDPEVDAVMIGTPDHWHAIQAIMACDAGKDVYIEKPCALTVNEGRQIAAAARKHNRIIQHGTQQRSGLHFQEAREYVQSGKLGKIAMSRNWAILGRGDIGKAPEEAPPAHLDYAMWLGPAPTRPYTANRTHYNWRFFWDYGTGDMGNWGVHWLDIALWSLGLEWPESIMSTGGMHIFDDDKETPDTQLTLYEYPDITVAWELRMWSRHGIHGRGTGTSFYGDQGSLIVDRGGFEVFSPDGRERLHHVRSSNNSLSDHIKDFLECVKSRRAPIADITNGEISAGVANLGNVAYLADEKIRYNPVANTLDKSDKNHLLTREYHNGWDLPPVSAVGSALQH